MDSRLWGKTKNNEEVFIYTISSEDGSIRAKVLNYGAIVLSLEVRLKDGSYRDVVLGYENLEDYFENPSYFGALVARCANRIGGAAVTINGKEYALDKNDGKNNLHSGFDPLCKRIWQVKEQKSDKITFSYDSPKLDMGFPGRLLLEVSYTVSEGALIIDYHGLSDEDTVFNPTNHSYFNLKGHGQGDILDHSLIIFADSFTCTNEESVATGEVRKVSGTPMDFRNEKRIGEDIEADYDQLILGKGYDHNYVLSKKAELINHSFDINGISLSKAAQLTAPDRSLVMDVFTDRPGAQVYSGNYISGDDAGKNGARYPRRAGIAIETQGYPNALNIDSFPNPLIKAGEDAYLRTVYKFRLS